MYQLKGHTATMRSSHAGPLGLPAPALPCPDSEAKAGRVWPCHRAWDVRDGMWSQHPGLLPPVVSLAVGSQLYQSCCHPACHFASWGLGSSSLPWDGNPTRPLRCTAPAVCPAQGPFPASSPYLADRKGMGVNQL